MEMADARYEFRSPETALVRARTEVHRFPPQALQAVVEPGLQVAERTQKLADAALEEAWARCRNLLFPLTVIVAVTALLLKLRQLEGPTRHQHSEAAGFSRPSGQRRGTEQHPP